MFSQFVGLSKSHKKQESGLIISPDRLLRDFLALFSIPSHFLLNNSFSFDKVKFHWARELARGAASRLVRRANSA